MTENSILEDITPRFIVTGLEEEVTFKDLKRSTYKTKYVVSFNWDKTKELITDKYLEEEKAILIHFITCCREEIVNLPVFDACDHYPDSIRVLARAQYIGNVFGVSEKEDSLTKNLEVAEIYLKHFSTPINWFGYAEGGEGLCTPYEIIKVIT